MHNTKRAVDPPRAAANQTGKAKKTLQNAPSSYETALEELKNLVQKLESGQLALDDLLRAHQRGMYLLGFCQQRLQALEKQVQVVNSTEVLKQERADSASNASAAKKHT